MGTYLWEFENGLNTSTEENPDYFFEYEGARAVKLTVTGPGGSNSIAKFYPVLPYQLSSNCIATYSLPSTYDEDAINAFRNNGLVVHQPLKIENSYSSDLDIRFYSPEDWLNGIYNNPRFVEGIAANGNRTININQITNEWGIQVVSSNGGRSCVRIIGSIGNSSGGNFYIKTEDIEDGVF